MGNTACQDACLGQNHGQNVNVVQHLPKQQQITMPKLADPVRTYLERQKPFKNRLPEKPEIIQYSTDVYCGKVDSRQRPHGYGKMFHGSGAVFVGQFINGKADGEGVFIKPDGSYYSGKFENNEAKDSQGFYMSNAFQYKGGFQQNEFHGQAEETGKTHRFTGIYFRNQKKKGTLTWSIGEKQYEYTGEFDENGQFTGKGKLKNDQGVYEGDFKNGKKDGQGVFTYNSGLKYIGDYVNGKKEGMGKLLKNQNNKQEIVYIGAFKNDMPHGQGKIVEEHKIIEKMWEMGIDSHLL